MQAEECGRAAEGGSSYMKGLEVAVEKEEEGSMAQACRKDIEEVEKAG